MWTTVGPTKDSQLLLIRKKSRHPSLVRSPKLTKVGGSLPFSPPAPQIEPGSGEVHRRRWKIEEKKSVSNDAKVGFRGSAEVAFSEGFNAQWA